MPFPNGVPSLSTMSRTLAAVDAEMVSLALINWIGEIADTRGIHIAVDGKGLRAAAHKVRDERTPYILEAWSPSMQPGQRKTSWMRCAAMAGILCCR